MREHNKAFVRLVAEHIGLTGPIYEFGSLQVEGEAQGQAIDLRGLFPGQEYVGCDFRDGPGVDRVEDVSQINLPDNTAGAVLCIETFEHVFEIRRAFDEVFRILKPGGVFVLTSPLNFRIHGYPDDYWRMTPSCLHRMLGPYAGKLHGWQGHASFPHTVMSAAIKGPASDFAVRAGKAANAYHAWLRDAEASLPRKVKLRRRIGRLYRSRGERNQLDSYYRAQLTLDVPGTAGLAAD
jgi:SAM-dependent methyltransferase